MQTINLKTAIHYMKSQTAKGHRFSITYFTYDDSQVIARGIRYVKSATLRSQAKSDKLKNAKHKLFYYNFDINEPRVCWLPLLAYVDNFKIKL